jgi:hypothetical protein
LNGSHHSFKAILAKFGTLPHVVQINIYTMSKHSVAIRGKDTIGGSRLMNAIFEEINVLKIQTQDYLVWLHLNQ